MKTINKIIIALTGIAFVACSDFLDTQSPSYDSGGIYESEAGLKEGVVGIYNLWRGRLRTRRIVLLSSLSIILRD